MSDPAEDVFEETALADTSLFIAREQQRSLASALPRRVAVSVVTIGELWLGVLAARGGKIRTQRLQTLLAAATLDPLPVDEPVARAWAALLLSLRDAGRRMPVNDSWIAATAIANGLPLATQDDDYDNVPGLKVIRL
ncbi:MAG: type II toxin-antitoxin system VapC family toxin [Candidatus Dormibacteria bacterium]